jgi:MFS family permease
MAPEPILPLELFRARVFTVSNIIAFISGIAMFGALAFLPQYLQLVHGVSATESGLLLLPLLLGLLVMSIGSGRYISRTGNYRWFPLAGTVLLTIGLFLLTHIGAHTSLAVIGLYILVFGAGLGLFMQVLTLIVQNAVPMRQMGVATSAVTFFRSMGGATGASALGAVLTARLAYEFPRFLPRASLSTGGGKASKLVQSPSALNALKRTNPALHEGIIQGCDQAIPGRSPIGTVRPSFPRRCTDARGHHLGRLRLRRRRRRTSRRRTTGHAAAGPCHQLRRGQPTPRHPAGGRRS